MNSRLGACRTAHPLPPPLDSSGQLLNAISHPYAHSFPGCLLMFISTGNRRMRSHSTGARGVPLSGSWLRLALSGSEAASPRCDVMALGFEMFLCKPGSGLQMICMFTFTKSAIWGTHTCTSRGATGGICRQKWALAKFPRNLSSDTAGRQGGALPLFQRGGCHQESTRRQEGLENLLTGFIRTKTLLKIRTIRGPGDR